MAAIEAYESAKGVKQRMTALTDVLVLCALTLLPPGETKKGPHYEKALQGQDNVRVPTEKGRKGALSSQPVRIQPRP